MNPSEPNPYQPPREAEAPPVEVMPGVRVDDPTTLARWSVSLVILGTLMSFGEYFLRLVLPVDSVLFGVQSALEGSYFLVEMAGLIIFLCWMYRVAWNARRRAPERMSISPGFAVGSFFIPIANFFVPCMAMVQVSRITRGEAKLVVLWWVLSMATMMVAIVWVYLLFTDTGTEFMMDEEVWLDEEGTVRPDLWEHVLMGFDVLTTFVEVVMVLGISRFQREWLTASQEVAGISLD